MSGPNYLLILSDLGFDCNDDVQILHAYLLIRSFIGQSEITGKTISEIARSPTFHKMLNGSIAKNLPQVDHKQHPVSRYKGTVILIGQMEFC